MKKFRTDIVHFRATWKRALQRGDALLRHVGKRYHALIPNVKIREKLYTFSSRFLVVLLVVLMLLPVQLAPTFAAGLYTTSATDPDGNTLLANNTVNDTAYYDTAQDSSPDTQRQLGIDPNWANGVTRKSGSIKLADGSNDYVFLTNPSNGSLAFGTGSFSFGLWVRQIAGVDTTDKPFTKGGTSAGTAGFSIVAGTSNWRVNVADGTSTTNAQFAASPPTLNTWQHLFAVIDRQSQTLKAYLNGVLINSTNLASIGSLTSSLDLGLGLRPASQDNPFQGFIDDVRIYGRALTDSEVARLASRETVTDTSLVLMYKFDELAGTTAYDSSPVGNDGTLMNGSSNSPAADGTANGPIWASGANAVMDGFKGCGPEDIGCSNPSGRSGAGNVSVTADSSTTSDNAYELQVRNSPGLDFNGTSASACFGDNLDLIGSSLTISAWIKPDTLVSFAPILNKLGSVGNYRLGFSGTSGALEFGIRNSGGTAETLTTSAGVVATGRWQHVAVAYDNATTAIIYVNGVEVARKTNFSITRGNTGTSLCMGYNSTNAAYYDGMQDDLRVFSRGLSATEIADLYAGKAVSQLGLEGWWKMDEGSGTSLTDSSGKGITGTVTNATWTEGARGGSTSSARTADSPAWIDGYQYREPLKTTNGASDIPAGYSLTSPVSRSSKLDALQTRADGKDWRVMYQPTDATRGLSFDGSDDMVTIPNSSSLSPTTAITISGWFKPSAAYPSNSGTTRYHAIASKSNSGLDSGISYTLDWYGTDSTAFLRLIASNGSTHISTQYSSAILTPGHWYHIAGTWTSGSQKLYLDGVQVASGTSTTVASLNSLDTTVRLGSAYTVGTNSTMLGNLDDVRIYNTVLPAGDISALYSGGSGTPNNVGTGLVGWWRLDEGSGQIVQDTSGNANHGFLGTTSGSNTSDSTWVTDGVVSTTYEVPRYVPKASTVLFDNVDDMGAVATDIDTQDIRTGSMSWGVWFKTTAGSGQLYRKSNSNAAGGVVIQVSGANQGSCTVGSSPQVVATGAFPNMQNNQWHHFGCVLDRGTNTLKMYADGQLKATVSATSLIGVDLNATSSARVSPCTGGSCFSGQLADMRIYAKVLSGDDFARVYSTGMAGLVGVPENGLVGAWRMDEGTGTSLSDYSGGGNAMVLTGSPVWVLNQGPLNSSQQTYFTTVAPIAASATSTDYFLYYGNASENGTPLTETPHRTGFNLDPTVSSTQRIGTAASNSYILSDTGSFSIWVKFDSLPASTHAIAQLGTGSAYANGFLVAQNSADVWLYWGSGSNVRRTTGSPLTTGVWYNIVVTMSAGTPAIYINGASPVVSGSGSGTAITTAQELYFGGNSSSSWTIDGTIDDARLYSRALSSAEAADIYSNIPAVSNSGLIGYWKMDEATGSVAADSSVTANNAAVSTSNFNNISGWVVNENLLDVANNPTLSTLNASADTNAPWFFQYRAISNPSAPSGSWSTLSPMSSAPTQLGSTGVKVKFNISGAYLRLDTFKIASWVVEAKSTSSPERGVRRTLPPQTNLIASNGGLDIIDAQTNKLWMRLPSGSNMMGSGAPSKVAVLNGRIYVAIPSATLVRVISLEGDFFSRYLSTSNGPGQVTIAARGTSSYVSLGSGAGFVADNSLASNGLKAKVVDGNPPRQYLIVGTISGTALMVNETANAGLAVVTATDVPTRAYSRTSGDDYGAVALSPSGFLYAANVTQGGVDRWDAVQSDTGDQASSTDRSYLASSGTTSGVNLAILRSGTVNDLSVSPSASAADYSSNAVAVATDAGVDLVNEHPTIASTTVSRYASSESVGSSKWSSKLFGGVAEFDGSSSRITLSDNAELSPGTGDMTVEAWVKLDTINGSKQTIFNNYGSVTNNVVQFVVTQTGKVQCSYRDSAGTGDTGALGTTTLSAGVWYHLACVKNGSSSRTVYINGVADATDNTTIVGVTVTGGAVPSIGRNASFGEVLDGMIDEVRVSNSVRYSSSFTPSAVPFTSDANTVGLWHMDESGPSQAANDASTYGNYGTLGSGITADSADPFLVSPALDGAAKVTTVGMKHSPDTGKSLSFDGSTDFVAIPANVALDITSNLTISMWINPTVSGNSVFRTILAKRDVGGTNYELYLSNAAGSNAGALGFFNGTQYVSSYVPVVGTWTHVAVTVSGTTMRLYANGVQVHSATISALSARTAATLHLGQIYTGAERFSGSQDDVRIYSRTLAGSEVSRLYNGGRGLNGGAESNLAGAWNMNEGAGQVVTDYSTTANSGTLGASSSVSTDDPAWSTTSPVREQPMLWVGTNGASADDGAVTAVSLTTNRRVVSYTTANSILPDNDVVSLSVGAGGLALVGAVGGAWNPGTAGIVVDDVLALAANQIVETRVKGGTLRIKPGTTRVVPGQ